MERCRLAQSQVSKITHDQIANPSIDMLVCICLVLRLTLVESVDLLSRAERALSPACSTHDVYKEIIEMYADLSHTYPGDSNMLVDADEYLMARAEPRLPTS